MHYARNSRNDREGGSYLMIIDIGVYLDVCASIGSEFPDWATDANRAYYIILLTFVTY